MPLSQNSACIIGLMESLFFLGREILNRIICKKILVMLNWYVVSSKNMKVLPYTDKEKNNNDKLI